MVQQEHNAEAVEDKKNVKLTTIDVKWKNQGHRRPCRRPVSLQGEVCHRKVNHVPTCAGAWRSSLERRSARGSLVDAEVPLGG